VVPTIGIVDGKLDEEPITGDEWLHMMQYKECINMLLFGEGGPLVFGSQVEDNLFVAAKVCKEVEEKVEKEEEETNAPTTEHNEDVFNIDFECR